MCRRQIMRKFLLVGMIAASACGGPLEESEAQSTSSIQAPAPSTDPPAESPPPIERSVTTSTMTTTTDPLDGPDGVEIDLSESNGFALAVMFPEGHVLDPLFPTQADIPSATFSEDSHQWLNSLWIDECGASAAMRDVEHWMLKTLKFAQQDVSVTIASGWPDQRQFVDDTFAEIRSASKCTDPQGRAVLSNADIALPERSVASTGMVAELGTASYVWFATRYEGGIVTVVEVESAGDVASAVLIANEFVELTGSRIPATLDHYDRCVAIYDEATLPETQTADPHLKYCGDVNDWRHARTAMEAGPRQTDPENTVPFVDRATTTEEEECQRWARVLATGAEVYKIQTGQLAKNQEVLIGEILSEEQPHVELTTLGDVIATVDGPCDGYDLDT